MNELKVQYVPIDEVIPYENNPRLNDSAVDAVANSISEFGFKVPIIVDKDNVIVAGHTRLKAAEKLGLTEVPVTVASDLTPEQVKAFRIADNKTAGLAEWDDAKLSEELKSLDKLFEMTDFGFGEFELQLLKADYTPEPYNDKEYDDYEQHEDEYLAKRRVIISYEPGQEQALCNLLGIDEVNKVTYELNDLIHE